MGYSGNTGFAASLGICLLLMAVPLSAEADERLRVKQSSAVPGQVVELSGPGIGAKGARVTIGGRPAAIVERHGHRIDAVVPAVSPGKARIVVRVGGSRLSSRLRIARGFSGSTKPKLDSGRGRSALIGPAGGTVTATGRDGTIYLLSIPRGALFAPTTITLTPLRAIGGHPLPGKPVGIQFGPDGLALAVPATLTVTLKRRAPRATVGFGYSGRGRGFSLEGAKRKGRTLTLRIEHFSGAGTATATIDSFVRLVAHYLIGKLTLEEVDDFLHQLQVIEAVFGPFCLTDATCQALFDRSVELLEHEAEGVRCERFANAGEALGVLRTDLMIEGSMRLLGKPRYAGEIANLEHVRRCITDQLVGPADAPARSDPLGLSGQATGLTKADRSNADVARDAEVWNAEWAIFLAGVAGQQGLIDLQARAQGAFESGLAKVLTDGKARCEQSFPEGSNLLKKGQKLADATLLLATEYSEAVAECKPRIFVTPAGATVEIDKTQAFSARSNDGDASFDWSSSDGAIDAAGVFTAPSTPGTVTVTAASRSRPVLTGSTTVTVVCPAGQVEFEGECRTISVTVSPLNPIVGPGETKQFTATVHNTVNQGVTWTASAGSISPSGLFTAPAQPGNYSITATSKEDSTRFGTTSVSVAQPGVNVTARSSQLTLSSRAFAGAASGENCPKPERDVHVKLDSRQGIPNPLGVWESFTVNGAEAPQVGCNASLADARVDQILTTTHDVESTDGDLTFAFSATDSHNIEMHRTGTQLDNEIGSEIYGLFGITFIVAAKPVTLSCSTTLSGDSRAGNPTETDPSQTLFQLELHDTTTGFENILTLHDTTAATEITLQPGKYQLLAENKTSRIRGNLTEDVLFTFGADAECHDV